MYESGEINDIRDLEMSDDIYNKVNMRYYDGKFGKFGYDIRYFKPIFDDNAIRHFWENHLGLDDAEYPHLNLEFDFHRDDIDKNYYNQRFDEFKSDFEDYIKYQYDDKFNKNASVLNIDDFITGWESYNYYVPDGFDRNYNTTIEGTNNELQDQLRHMYFQLGMLERPPLRGPLHVTLKPTDYFLDNYADDVESKAEEYEKLGQPNVDDLALFTTVGDKAYTSGLRIPITVESYKNGVMEITSSVQKTKNADAEIFNIDNLTVDVDENGCKNADVMSISLNGIDMFVVNFAEDQRIMIGQKDRKITNKHKIVDVSNVYNKGLDISRSFDDYDNGVTL